MAANNPRAHEPVDREYLDLRLEAVDLRIDALGSKLRAVIAEGFAQVEQRFGDLERRITSVAIGITLPLTAGIFATLVAVLVK